MYPAERLGFFVHQFNGAFSVVYLRFMLATQDSTATRSSGICRKPLPEPTITRVHITNDGRLYEHMDSYSQNIPTDNLIDRLEGAILNVEPWVTTKDTVFKPAGSATVKIVGTTGDPMNLWQLELPCTYYDGRSKEWIMFEQCHYRSLFSKMLNVDMQATAVMLRAKSGTSATFINVFLDERGQVPVQGGCIPKGKEAFDKSVNEIRAGLGLPPLNPEWLTPKTTDSSLTASPPIDCDSLPVD